MDSSLWSDAKARLIYTDDDGVEHDLSLWKERDAVIEAAKAVSRHGCGVITPQVSRLYKAVEALQAVEGERPPQEWGEVET